MERKKWMGKSTGCEKKELKKERGKRRDERKMERPEWEWAGSEQQASKQSSSHGPVAITTRLSPGCSLLTPLPSLFLSATPILSQPAAPAPAPAPVLASDQHVGQYG